MLPPADLKWKNTSANANYTDIKAKIRKQLSDALALNTKYPNISKNQKIAIDGDSGSGKSTFLKILSATPRASSPEILITPIPPSPWAVLIAAIVSLFTKFPHSAECFRHLYEKIGLMLSSLVARFLS